MRIVFPDGFFWGTSTAAAQVETAGDHPWCGLKARDGHEFRHTTDHEKRRSEDADLILRFGTVYRCSVDWSRLQPEPMARFDKKVVGEYVNFFEKLQKGGVKLMFVLHHFAHPNWFEARGGWTNEDNIPFFLDFVRQCLKHFEPYVRYWNTFNEPNVYAMNAFLLGNFPPGKKHRYGLANRVLDNMGRAHEIARVMIGEKSDAPVGISLNTAHFEGTGLAGSLVAAFVRWWFMTRAARPFRKCDFWGLSYYAFVPFAPFPLDVLNNRAELEKRHIPHDNLWGYKPEGLGPVLRRFAKKYGKPIVITENGLCTDDPQQRIRAIRDYLKVCREAIDDGVNLLGYIHWSTWDNFEWHLGPTFRFGLVRVDFRTMERSMTPAGLFYEKVVRENGLEV